MNGASCTPACFLNLDISSQGQCAREKVCIAGTLGVLRSNREHGAMGILQLWLDGA